MEEENDLQLNRLVFSVSQYSGESINDIWGWDVIKFFHTLALLNDKARSENQKAQQK